MKKIIIAFLFLSACSSTGPKRVTIDSSGDKPKWVEDNKTTWTDGDTVFFKSKNTVRGDQRENGCRDLASMDNREELLKGMASELKTAIDNAQTDISENAELVLGKVRSGKWEGRIVGLRDDQSWFERYQIRDDSTAEKTERIDCYILSKISKHDYAETKRAVVNKIVAVDPRLKEAITQKQIRFFSEKAQAADSREPSASKSAPEDDNQ